MGINSSPGLEGIEKITEVDVAGKIIEFIVNNASEVDNSDCSSGMFCDRIKY